MYFLTTTIPGVWVIESERKTDQRGFFSRIWCAAEFAKRGLISQWKQCSISHNQCEATLRGMHFQKAPHEEAKLILCTAGSLYDVVVDLRPQSPSYCQWFAVTLSRENGNMIYVPPGVAHGFQTLEPNTDVLYQISEFYDPRSVAGVRWDDSAFGIRWPDAERRHMSQQDESWPDFMECVRKKAAHASVSRS